MTSTMALWVTALPTIAILSFAYKENPAYRFVEYLYVGGTAGHALVAAINSVRSNGFDPLMKGNLGVVIPIILGIMLYARFFANLRHISRIPIAVIVGTGIGLTAAGSVNTDFLAQIRATMVPFTNLNNIIIVLGVLGTLIYFWFTVPVKKRTPLDAISTFGVWMLMVFFGTQIGLVAMSRLSLLIGRIQFLLGDFMRLIPQ